MCLFEHHLYSNRLQSRLHDVQAKQKQSAATNALYCRYCINPTSRLCSVSRAMAFNCKRPATSVSIFRLFLLADVLESTEYNSSVGKAQSTFSGLDLMAGKLRGMVVAPENSLVELTTKDIAQKMTNAKQRGHERTHARTYMRACMHDVSCGVMAFHNISIVQCAPCSV